MDSTKKNYKELFIFNVIAKILIYIPILSTQLTNQYDGR